MDQTDAIINFLRTAAVERQCRALHIAAGCGPIVYELTDWDIVREVIHVD